MDEVEAEGVTKGAVTANASSAVKPVDRNRVATDLSLRPVEPPSAAASVEQKAAAKACDVEATAREDKATPRSEEQPVVNDEQDNEAHMPDASTFATKRPWEWKSDEPKVGAAEWVPVKLPPSKGPLRKKDVAACGES